MLGEEYDIYLRSSLLLLAGFVFLFLVLLTLAEWSRSSKATMKEDSEMTDNNNDNDEDVHMDEDRYNNANNPNNNNNEAMGSNYNNKAPTAESQLLDKYISKVDFNMIAEDLDKPWFHRTVTRAMATELLKGKDQGAYIVRPSSQRGSYAMSWVKSSHSGEISHSLIHGLFPGFALKQNPTLEERYV